MRSSWIRSAIGLGVASVLGACALSGSSTFPSDSEARPAIDVPLRFDPRTAADRIAPADTLAGGGCLSPLVDPSAGTELRLVRSGSGRGDYEMPPGSYGSRPGELLRIECNTGRVIGIVKR